METTKENAMDYLKNCDMCDMYDFFYICRERHNGQMFKDR